MTHVLIRHKIADYAKWKVAYDQHVTARLDAGLTQTNLWRNLTDEHEVFILFRAEDPVKAAEFIEAPGLHEAMIKAGVVDKPDVYFLT